MSDDGGITERKQKRMETTVAETAAGLTIAERLTRRAKERTVSLELSDHEGDFEITMRQPTRAEMDGLQKMQIAIQNESTQDEANDRLCVSLGDLCLDESLDYEFWMAGNYSMQGLFQLCVELGKLPHEFVACSDEEFEYLKMAWNEKTRRENELIKKAGR